MPESEDKVRMIFVTGASRSGTTVLARILGKAEGAYTLHELHFFGELVPFEQSAQVLPRERAEKAVAMTLARHARDYYVDGPTAAERQRAAAIVAALPGSERTGDRLFAVTMEAIARDTGARALCEQTPRNIFYAFHLLEAYPGAEVVHVVRDPRAVLASQKNRYQLRKLGGRNVPLREVTRLWLNYHPITMVRLWLGANREALELKGHPRFRIVRYEDLVSAPVATVEPLCRELGLDFQASMLDVPHWGSSTTQHTSAFGLSAAGLDKWKSILDGAEIRYCSDRTAELRRAFGYADVEAPVGIGSRLRFAARLPVHVAGTVLANPRRAAVQLKAMFARGRGPKGGKPVADAPLDK